MSMVNVFLNDGFVAAKKIPQRAVTGAHAQHGRPFFEPVSFDDKRHGEFFLHHRLIVLLRNQRDNRCRRRSSTAAEGF